MASREYDTVLHNSEVANLLSEYSDIFGCEPDDDTAMLASWVVRRYGKNGTWDSLTPDQSATEEEELDESEAEMVTPSNKTLLKLVDCYLSIVKPQPWSTLLASLIAEQQVRMKVIEPIIDTELDADKQQRAYMLKVDLAASMADMRKSNDKMLAEVMGTGEIGDKAARKQAALIRRAVTPELNARRVGDGR